VGCPSHKNQVPIDYFQKQDSTKLGFSYNQTNQVLVWVFTKPRTKERKKEMKKEGEKEKVSATVERPVDT
jgi:hypothetical protein